MALTTLTLTQEFELPPKGIEIDPVYANFSNDGTKLFVANGTCAKTLDSWVQMLDLKQIEVIKQQFLVLLLQRDRITSESNNSSIGSF